jgi:glycosyltransferase involved in cell wall biosynthesis
MISVVITSFNRKDLLLKTVESFLKFNTYPIDKFIIIEDSGDKEMYDFLSKHNFNFPSNYTLILNENNIGAYESIDKAYYHVQSKYVCHIEDDWEFYKGGFIKPAIDIMEGNPEIMQVNLSNDENMPIEDHGYGYGIVGDDVNGWWHGFTCRPAIRSMAAYNEVKPWTQWAVGRDLSIKECMVGMRYYELGYKAAVLNEYFCKHTGGGRCTWHENI